jgi:hypothetical protein
VVAAEEFEVPESGGTAVCPMPDVMNITPPGRRDHPGGPADIDRFRLGSEHHPADGAVTGVSAYLSGVRTWPLAVS